MSSNEPHPKAPAPPLALLDKLRRLTRWMAVRLFWQLCAIASGAVAMWLAMGSSPGLLPDGGRNFGNNWQYGLLLMLLPALAALFPTLSEGLRRPLTLSLATVIVMLTAGGIGHSLPFGGYDFYAKIGLYWVSFLSGVVFAVVVRLVSDKEHGREASTRVAGLLTIVFIVLSVTFAGAQPGGIILGEAWPSHSASAVDMEPLGVKVLYEATAPGSYVAVQPASSANGKAPPILLLASFSDRWAIIDPNSGTAHEFSLLPAITGALPESDRPRGEAVKGRFQDMRISSDLNGSDAPDAETSVTASGLAALTFPERIDLRGVEFVVDISLGERRANVVARSAHVGYEVFGSNKMVIEGLLTLDDIMLEVPGKELRLIGDRKGVSLLQSDLTVWRLKIAVSPVGLNRRFIAWARPTGTGGVVFAVERMEWKDISRRGSGPGYQVYTVYYVGPV